MKSPMFKNENPKYKNMEELHPKNKMVYIPIATNKKNPPVMAFSPIFETPAIDKFFNNKTGEEYNIGLLTGRKNNIVVIDIDNKRHLPNGEIVYDGLELFEKMMKDHPEITTLIQKSQSGSYHLIYKYIEGFGMRDTGLFGFIDIRTDQNYIMVGPSTINGKTYELINNNEIQNMPDWLYRELIVERTRLYSQPKDKKDVKALKKIELTKLNENELNNLENQILENSFCESIDETKPDNLFLYDYEIKGYLDLLPEQYLNNYALWLSVLSACKSLDKRVVNKYKLFDDWSKQSKSYDSKENKRLWDKMDSKISFNYVFSAINQMKLNFKLDYLPNLKKFEPLNEEMIKFDKITLDSKHLDQNKFLCHKDGSYRTAYDSFLKKYRIFIMKSDTGTAKTSGIVQLYCREYAKKYKFISLCSRVSLCEQQQRTFKDNDKKDKNNNIVCDLYTNDLRKNDDRIICQIDSLLKLRINEADYKNYILYIDEIDSFIKYLLTSNMKTIQENRILIYSKLIKLIKNCHKVFLTDADISNKTIKFIDGIDNVNTLFMKNTYKNYKGIKAYHLFTDKKAIEVILEHARNEESLIVATDSLDTLKNIREYLENEQTNIKIQYFSSEDGNTIDELLNVVNNYDDKNDEYEPFIVVYSPKIVYGVDFQPAVPTDSLFIGCGHSIDVLEMVQQLCRNRKMKDIYYQLNNEKHYNKFDDVEEVKTYYGDFKNVFTNIMVQYCAVYIDDNTGEYELCNNKLTEIYFEHVFTTHFLNCDPLYYFTEILMNKGFEIIENEDEGELPICLMEIIKMKKDRREKRLDDYANDKEESMIFNNKHDKLIETLHITKQDLLNEENEYIRDIIKKPISDHFNIIRYLRDEKYEYKIKKNDMEYNIYKSDMAKMNFLRQIEKMVEVNIFNIEQLNREIKISNSESIIKTYNELFRGKLNINTKLNFYNDIKIIIVSMYKHLMGDIMETERKQVNKVRTTKYSCNIEYVLNHLKLYKYRGEYKNLNKSYIKLLNLEIEPEQESIHLNEHIDV